MRKRLSITVLAISLIGLFSFTAGDYVQIKLHNPCDEKVVFAYSTSPNGNSSTKILYSGETDSWNVKQGYYINYKIWNTTKYKPIGKVEYKGQVFNCGCD